MSRSDKLSMYKTTISYSENKDFMTITYHATPIVRVNDKEIILNFGGYDTVTTRRKMNQASQQFGLGYSVFREKGKTYIAYKHHKTEYNGSMIIIEPHNQVMYEAPRVPNGWEMVD